MDRYLIIRINIFNEIRILGVYSNFNKAKNAMIDITGKFSRFGVNFDSATYYVVTMKYYMATLNEKN